MEGIQFCGEFFPRSSSDNAVEQRFQISIETCGTYSTVQYLNACESRMLHTNTILLLLGRAGPRNTLRRRSGGTGKCGAVNSGGAASLAVAKMTETHVNPGVCCQMRKHRNPIRCYALFTHPSVPGSMGHSGLLKPLLWNYLWLFGNKITYLGQGAERTRTFETSSSQPSFQERVPGNPKPLAPHLYDLLYSTSKASKHLPSSWILAADVVGRCIAIPLSMQGPICRSICVACCSFDLVTPCESTHQFLMSLPH